LTANYVGSSTVHLQSGRELNPAVFLGLGACTINGINYPVCSTVGNTNDRRELSLRNRKEGQYYGNIYELDDGGTGNYNALFLSAQKRLSGGTSILANYTWSHCISDFWNAFIRAPQAPGDGPGGRRSERGNCANTDQRHSANFSIVAQSPRFERRALRMMAGNWQLSPILKIRSGQYFTVTTGVDNTLTGLADTRPNQVLANPYLPHKSVDGWLNPKAFAVPAAGTWGNLGANNIIGPGSVQLDLALSRTFRLAEQKTIQLRGEAFNLPNHLNPSNPIAVMTNAASFGKILTDNVSTLSGVVTGNPRIIQIALKVVF
jgi:hypothetical protein